MVGLINQIGFFPSPHCPFNPDTLIILIHNTSPIFTPHCFNFIMSINYYWIQYCFQM